MARSGARSPGPVGGCTSGWQTHPAPSGPLPGIHPSQGGLQTLGKDDAVGVNMHDKFQQPLPIDSEVPQFQFIEKVLDIPVITIRVRTNSNEFGWFWN